MHGDTVVLEARRLSSQLSGTISLLLNCSERSVKPSTCTRFPDRPMSWVFSLYSYSASEMVGKARFCATKGSDLGTTVPDDRSMVSLLKTRELSPNRVQKIFKKARTGTSCISKPIEL